VITARLYSPAHIVVIDMTESRLQAAKMFGADTLSWPAPTAPLAAVRALTGGHGKRAILRGRRVLDRRGWFDACFHTGEDQRRPAVVEPSNLVRRCAVGVAHLGDDTDAPGVAEVFSVHDEPVADVRDHDGLGL